MTDKRANGSRRMNLESLVVRAGAVGAALLFAMLWFERHLIVRATTQDILVFGSLAVAIATVLAAIVTANVVLPALSERSGDITDVLHAVAHGDLTREPQDIGDGENGERVAAAARSALASLRGSIGEVRTATRDVAARAQDLTMQCTAAVSVAQRATEAASSIVQQSSMIVELSHSAHEDGARLAAGASRVIGETRAQRQRDARLREISQESLSHLQTGTSALDELSGLVSVGADELGMLAGASEEIRSFVTLVRKMARQSKLLALNAAMEAARAGEHGSGFAVVASEVRRLARSSSEAADRTDQLVSDVLERIERVRAASSQAVDSVRVVRESTAGGLASLQGLEQEAGDSMTRATAEEDSVSGVTAAGDALVLRLEQLAREADALGQALRSVSTAASGQQGRLQEIAVAANALGRSTTRAITAANSFRAERVDSPSQPDDPVVIKTPQAATS